MDAIAFYNRTAQYTIKNMKRELVKAYTCFRIPASVTDPKSGIATGNWGCGAFNGNKQLKGNSRISIEGLCNLPSLLISDYPINCRVTSRTSACLFNISWSKFSSILLGSVRIFIHRKSDSEGSLHLSSTLCHLAHENNIIRLYSPTTCIISLLVIFEM